jgi:hypothetical protein
VGLQRGALTELGCQRCGLYRRKVAAYISKVSGKRGRKHSHHELEMAESVHCGRQQTNLFSQARAAG